jgi:putative ABC transport system substrate-binding protein
MALKQETTQIPIVMLATPDPVRLGLITNIPRPDGNVTGVAWLGFDILPKRIELLKEIVPHLKRLAVITSVYVDSKIIELIEEYLAVAARTLGFEWRHFRPTVANEYEGIFARIAEEQFDAAYIQADQLSIQIPNATRIIQLTLRYRIPAIQENSWWTRQGLLMSYGQDYYRDIARASEYVVKLLRGAMPNELPIEQTTELNLVINLKTAKTLGLTVPASLIVRAHEVIE